MFRTEVISDKYLVFDLSFVPLYLMRPFLLDVDECLEGNCLSFCFIPVLRDICIDSLNVGRALTNFVCQLLAQTIFSVQYSSTSLCSASNVHHHYGHFTFVEKHVLPLILRLKMTGLCRFCI